MVLYIKWADQKHDTAFPVTEELLHDYLRYAVTQSASRASSFLDTLAFAGGLFGLDVGPDAMSPRNLGLAASGSKAKRRRIQRSPMAAGTLKLCETVLARNFPEAACISCELPLPVLVVLGFLVFRIHTRLRCGDAARISIELAIDGAVRRSRVATRPA